MSEGAAPNTSPPVRARAPHGRAKPVQAVVKRGLDVAGAAIGLVVSAPLMAAIAVAVRLTMGSPVLFRQQRAGRHGRPFVMRKFRTLAHPSPPGAEPLSDAARLTPLGRLLRSTSLDEVPELLNVLKGEMSLVGPRPLLMRYLPRYTAEQARRHDVRPGITGWAQVNGRNAIAWREKFALDVWYVDHWSLWLDLEILLLTAWRALRREGISQPGHATAEEFLGDGPASDIEE